MYLRLSALALLLASTSASPVAAQDLDDLRSALSDSLADIHFADSLAKLVLVADEMELSAATYEVDDEFDTELKALSFPFHTTTFPWGADATGLYVEGVLGYANADQRIGDLYAGEVAGLETEVRTEWKTYGGLIGAGPEFELSDEVTLAAIASVGLAHLENDAGYSGPGAAFSASFADGIAFNWQGTTLTTGAALRVDWRRALGEQHELELVGRYDLRHTEAIEADDPAQEFRSRSQVATVRCDVLGPTGFEAFGNPLMWRSIVGARQFLEADLFGSDQLYQVGGALEVDAGDALPFGRMISISATYAFGDDLSGSSYGISIAL